MKKKKKKKKGQRMKKKNPNFFCPKSTQNGLSPTGALVGTGSHGPSLTLTRITSF
jgi:hypothetical protein